MRLLFPTLFPGIAGFGRKLPGRGPMLRDLDTDSYNWFFFDNLQPWSGVKNQGIK
jgi:hypothetical protein